MEPAECTLGILSDGLTGEILEKAPFCSQIVSSNSVVPWLLKDISAFISQCNSANHLVLPLRLSQGTSLAALLFCEDLAQKSQDLPDRSISPERRQVFLNVAPLESSLTTKCYLFLLQSSIPRFINQDIKHSPASYPQRPCGAVVLWAKA